MVEEEAVLVVVVGGGGGGIGGGVEVGSLDRHEVGPWSNRAAENGSNVLTATVKLFLERRATYLPSLPR